MLKACIMAFTFLIILVYLMLIQYTVYFEVIDLHLLLFFLYENNNNIKIISMLCQEEMDTSLIPTPAFL